MQATPGPAKAWGDWSDFEILESALNFVLGICGGVLWSKHCACYAGGRSCDQRIKGRNNGRVCGALRALFLNGNRL